ncbi:hypothetical protein C725_1544 [Pacificimonas flava]|uniref:Uncharacterized protein n=1 Tax=Pacificimonas flava TaxID=1234595 RepID=M2TMJ5_9SPHN|nr:hypothetical protein C725_1544 [Pacificimonas flava]
MSDFIGLSGLGTWRFFFEDDSHLDALAIRNITLSLESADAQTRRPTCRRRGRSRFSAWAVWRLLRCAVAAADSHSAGSGAPPSWESAHHDPYSRARA